MNKRGRDAHEKSEDCRLRGEESKGGESWEGRGGSNWLGRGGGGGARGNRKQQEAKTPGHWWEMKGQKGCQ